MCETDRETLKAREGAREPLRKVRMSEMETCVLLGSMEVVRGGQRSLAILSCCHSGSAHSTSHLYIVRKAVFNIFSYNLLLYKDHMQTTGKKNCELDTFTCHDDCNELNKSITKVFDIKYIALYTDTNLK